MRLFIIQSIELLERFNASRDHACINSTNLNFEKRILADLHTLRGLEHNVLYT
ncbi:MAG: hypothetical protein ACI837_003424 [Crocinitomicaceae bacterium]|jgi:hypothetical protein